MGDFVPCRYTIAQTGRVTIYRFPEYTWTDMLHDFKIYGGLARIYVDILKKCSSYSYYFETPRMKEGSYVEFAIIRRNDDLRFPDPSRFKIYIDSSTPYFVSPSGTGLVIPTNVDGAYTNISSFFASAPENEIRSLLRTISEQNLTGKYFSTAGDDVAWLHFRISDTPRYYQYYTS